MKKLKLYTLCAISAAVLSACGDDKARTLNAADNSTGSVSIAASATTLINGVELSASVSDGDGITSEIRYQWNANGFPISGATSALYVVSDTYAGATISVSAVYTDDAGFTETLISSSTGAIVANEVGLVVITGDVAQGTGTVIEASVTDANGVTSEVTYSWAADGVTIDGETGATLTLTDSMDGKAITVTVSYADDAGFTESVTSEPTSAVGVTNTPATFDGLAATVTNDTALHTGTITVTDPDTDEDALVSQSSTTTSYGTFSVDENGDWTYNLNTNDATVAALAGSSDSVEDTVVVESVDGNVATLVITITGKDSNARAAVIRDTDSSDTGELRYGFDTPMLAGKLVASFNKASDAIEINDEFAAKDAYITFYNSTGSTSSGRAIADLRIQTDKFVLRDQDDIVVANPFTPDTWQDVEITWEAANDITPPMVTVTIDGVAVTAEAFSSPDAAVGGVTAIAFRFADNTAILPDDITYQVDDIEIYSDAAGTTLVFEDDFESYADGEDLDPDNNNSSVYHSSTFQAVAEEIEDPNDTPDAAVTQYAQITDTDSSDTGELRYGFDTPMLSGKLVASFNKPADAVEINDEFAAKDAYITFYNSTGSTSSGRAIADLRIQTDKFVLRDQDDIVVANPFTPDTWQDVEITWEAANDITPPMVTVTIDGVAVTTEAFSSPDAAVGGVTAIAFRFADNTAILPDDISYKVDDIEIYSDAAGTTLVFEDDFEAYAEGDDLDPDNNNSSVYHSSTFQAVVAANSDDVIVDEGSDDATSGPGVAGNQVSSITDTDSSDTGELRYGFDTPMLAGKLVASFNKASDAIETNDELAAKDAYITFYNSTGSTSSGRAIADLRIQTDKFVLRDQDDIVVANPFTPDTWQDVEITWEAANDITPPMVTVTIDGVAVTTEAFSSPDAAVGGVTAIAFRFADNTAILPDDITYQVDDIEIYSDAAGTTLVFEDDFESYADGDDLDPDNNNSSVYHSSTFQAVVATEE